MKDTWKSLPVKDKLAYSTAIAAFIIGWCMVMAGFVVPPVGEVADSVLWILGQALIYAASIFGVTQYFNSEQHKLRNEINGTLRRYEETVNSDID